MRLTSLNRRLPPGLRFASCTALVAGLLLLPPLFAAAFAGAHAPLFVLHAVLAAAMSTAAVGVGACFAWMCAG